MLLHILWMILKFIFIILGVLLGILLLAVLLVLFCPVRYRASAIKEEEALTRIQADGSVSWLFHGIWIKIHFADQKLTREIRIFGISLESLKKFLGLFRRKKEKIPAA